jgi:hypothetical protein
VEKNGVYTLDRSKKSVKSVDLTITKINSLHKCNNLLNDGISSRQIKNITEKVSMNKLLNFF